MNTNEEINNYITYDFNTKGISKLNLNQKNFYISSIINQSKKLIYDYESRNLSSQDLYIFGFSELKYESENKSTYFSYIQKIIENIENSNNYEYIKRQIVDINNMDNKGIYNISYKEICAIVNFIIYILKEILKKKKFAEAFFIDEEIPNNKIEINGVKLKSVLLHSDSVKQINICISEKNKNISESKTKYDINIYAIELFMLFFQIFFKNILTLNIDLNIYEINNYFSKEMNPYKITENNIASLFKNYEKIALGNLIIIKKLSKFSHATTIKFILYDSYQIELYKLMIKYFKRNIETTSQININCIKEEDVSPFQNKLLYFSHIIYKVVTNYLDIKFDINSLDPLLFFNINLLLQKYKSVINININFFDLENINLRKTLINAYYFNLFFTEKEKNIINPLLWKYYPDQINEIFEDDYKIYYNYINDINGLDNKLLLRDEEIINELFPYFNYNLNVLFFILIEKIMSDKNQQNSLSLNFKSNNGGTANLNLYNNYNCSILSFIFNLFYIIENTKNLENLCLLDLSIDDLSEDKQYIIYNIFKDYRNNKVFDFKNLNLTCFRLDITNFSIFLPFENFPSNRLTELVLKNLTYKDLENISNTLINNKKIFPKLVVINLEICFMIEDFRKHIQILLKNKFSENLINFGLTIPSYITYKDFVDIFDWIKKNKNKNTSYYLKLSNEDLCEHLEDIAFDRAVSKFKNIIKKDLIKRNIIANIKSFNYTEINVELKTLDYKEKDFFLKFIYCFNKTHEKNNKKIMNDNTKDKDGKNNSQKIFENIFYYMGKIGKGIKNININII